MCAFNRLKAGSSALIALHQARYMPAHDGVAQLDRNTIDTLLSLQQPLNIFVIEDLCSTWQAHTRTRDDNAPILGASP